MIDYYIQAATWGQSVTHLHSYATSIFASDWLHTETRVKVLPAFRAVLLVPMARESFPANLLRQMLELAAWMATV
jgi:hypothetical protein